MGLKVMVVDDNANILAVLREYLSDKVQDGRSFRQVDTFSSLDAALAVLKELSIADKYDCILLDWVMQRGGTVADSIPTVRRYAPFSGIIVVSGHDSPEDVIDIMRSGVDAFVGKKKMIKNLVSTILAVVRLRASSLGYVL